jgi:ankyrin repeat protein
MEVHAAALGGDMDTLRRLASTQANARTPEGYTPLSLAVSAGHEAACRLLLREGADVNAADNAGINGR